MRRCGDQGFQTWIQFQITRLTDPCHPGLGSDQGFLAFFCSGFPLAVRWDFRQLQAEKPLLLMLVYNTTD